VNRRGLNRGHGVRPCPAPGHKITLAPTRLLMEGPQSARSRMKAWHLKA
jgi:hypothetical protein